MRRAPNLWRALLSGPGFLLSRWPWRAVAYLVSGVPAGAVTLLALVVLTVCGSALAVVLVGLPLLVLTVLAGIPVGAVERRRLRLIDPAPLGSPHRGPLEPGLGNWLRTRLRERVTWRELGYAVLFAVVLWPVEALAVTTGFLAPLSMVATPLAMATGAGGSWIGGGAGDGVHGGRAAKVLKLWTVTSWPAAFGVAVLGVLLLALGAYALALVASARGGLTRLLLGPPSGTESRVGELTRSRLRLVDAFEAERRRIERDLHDGAQQRLVALTMTLGLARLDAPPGPLADQLAKAQDEAGTALAELRGLIHGIHPQVLTDYGLEAAVTDAADRSPIPVDVTLPAGRLPRAVEAAAYFVVCEALANVARHSGASRATVRGGHTRGRLCLEIGDDGCGGATTDGPGTGLTGLADRVSVVDGTLTLTSPPGGPTLLRVEIPCALPRPRSPR